MQMIETASHKLAALLRVCALGTPVRIIFLSFRLCKPYRAVDTVMYGCCRRAISWQEEYADLSFLNSPFRRLLYVLPDSYNVGHLSLRCYSDRLHKELVATSCVRRWVLFHCLKKDCSIYVISLQNPSGGMGIPTLNFNIATRLDSTGIGAHTVSIKGLGYLMKNYIGYEEITVLGL